MRVDFDPPLMIRNHLQQSLLGGRCPVSMAPSLSEVIRVSTTDSSGDVLALVRGTANASSKNVTIIVPGLGNSARSPVVRRLAFRIEERGHRVYRMNHRGAGEGFGLARGIYHGGRSDDLKAIVDAVLHDNPEVKVVNVVSMSLGSNIVLKAFSGIESSSYSSIVRHIAISPVIHLKESSQAMSRIGFGLFERSFEKSINRYCSKRHELFKDLGPFQKIVPFKLSRFDEEYTAPHAGFKSSDEYYLSASAAYSMGATNVKTTLIYSLDDPLVPFKNFPKNKLIHEVVTRFGGHLGFVTSIKNQPSSYWIDSVVLESV